MVLYILTWNRNSIETVPVMYYSCTCGTEVRWNRCDLFQKLTARKIVVLLAWNIICDQPGTYLELTYVGIQVPGIYVPGIYVLSGT